MKSYAIISDEDKNIRVVPSKWLNVDKKLLYWPPYEKTAEIKDAIIKQKDVEDDWDSYEITRYLKSNGTLF